MPALPSKSAHFVIDKLEQAMRAIGDGVSVKVDGRPIERIEWDTQFVQIVSKPLDLQAACLAYARYAGEHGHGFDPREAMKAALEAAKG